MSYSPAPLALDRTKPHLWNAEGSFVAPEYQSLWHRLHSLYMFNDPGVAVPATADVARRVLSPEGSSTIPVNQAGRHGVERVFNASQAGYRVATIADWGSVFGGLGNATFWVFGKITTYGQGRRMFAATSGTGSGDMLFGCHSGGAYRADIRIGGSQRSVSGDNVPLDGYIHLLGVIRNGVLEAYTAREDEDFTLRLAGTDSTGQGSTLNFDGSNNVCLGGKNGSELDTNRNLNGVLVSAGAWTRALTEPELQRLVDDPSGLIRPNWDYVTTGFSSTSLYATGDGTIVDVVNESDAASPLSPSIDDDPASPDDNDWVNNAVDVT